MKVICPVCGRMGVLQIRGNNKRVIHYEYDVNGKRRFWQHLIHDGNSNSNGNSSTVTEQQDKRLLLENKSLGRASIPRPTAYKAVALPG